MSRIFALVATSTSLLVGSVAMATAVDSSGAENESLDEIVAIFATSFEISMFVPFVIAIGLGLAALAVMAR